MRSPGHTASIAAAHWRQRRAQTSEADSHRSLMEGRFHQGLQIQLDHRSSNPVRNPWECRIASCLRRSSVSRPCALAGGSHVPDDMRFQIL